MLVVLYSRIKMCSTCESVTFLNLPNYFINYMYKDKFYIYNKLTTQFNHVSTPSRLKSPKPRTDQDARLVSDRPSDTKLKTNSKSTMLMYPSSTLYHLSSIFTDLAHLETQGLTDTSEFLSSQLP